MARCLLNRFHAILSSFSSMKQPLDTRQIRAFCVLARKASFTLAARELFLSQSAVSHSMRALEEDIGCRLFDRVGKKVLLTQAGEQLLQHAEKILEEMRLARESIEQLGKWGHGRLRIGASTTACQYILPSVLRQFKQQFNNSVLNIEPGDTPAALELIRKNRIDIAVGLQPEFEHQMEFTPLFTDELFFLVSANHPWAISGHVVRAEIPKQKFIFYNKGSYTFRLIEDYFRDEAMVLNTVIELGSMEAIKELVKLGLGVSVLAPWIAPAELAAKTMVALPLGKRKLRRTWGIFHWKGKRLSLAEESFVSLCKAACESISGPAVSLSAA
jgi:DNA-binding transcriptional LysR family regulator